jgi:hypothetical protein
VGKGAAAAGGVRHVARDSNEVRRMRSHA